MKRYSTKRRGGRRYSRWILCVGLCAVVITQSNCGTSSTPPSSSPPPSVTVTVQPPSTVVALGVTQQFQATVTGTSNASVMWEVNGLIGGSSTDGTVSPNGAATATYTAPNAMPSPGTITITAISQADPQASASATVTLTDGISITVSPATANVPTGGAQLFTATISGNASAGTGATWSVDGIAGGNAIVGTIAASSATTALYTAPAVPPSPATVTVTATSTADSSKSGSASVTVECGSTNSISPSPVSVSLGQAQTFTASFCTAAGATIAWDVNGVTGGNSTVGTIVTTSANSATYTAPSELPPSNPVTIHASVTLPSGSVATVSASVTITSGVSVSVSPGSATLLTGQRQSFSATVVNSPDATVTWFVDGVLNGNATVGQICESGSNPCVAPSGPLAGSVDYLAPASVPPTNPVSLTATSTADPSKSGSASITITTTQGSASVSVSPPYAFIAASAGTPSTVQFTAAVANSSSTSVTWSVQSAVAGEGCSGTACGSISSSGLYTAPGAAPSPNAIAVIATSQTDPAESAVATVAIASGPTIETLLPSSTMAGAAESFPLTVQGVNFVAGSGTGASVILLNGAIRSTTCASTMQCTTVLNPADVESAGTLTVQVQNPGNPPVLSNLVPFVVVPFDVSVGTISLTSSQPVTAGNDIVVTEPTTAASSAPINVDFVGMLTGGNTCGVQGSPLTVTRPASGSITVSICVHGNGLDPTFTYAFTGPGGAPGGDDIGVTASAISGLFPDMIQLNLQISSSTLPGVRSLVITTLNNDRAIATGMLEVK